MFERAQNGTNFILNARNEVEKVTQTFDVLSLDQYANLCTQPLPAHLHSSSSMTCRSDIR